MVKKKEVQKIVLLSDAIKEYGDNEGEVFIHKYNMPGYFKYKTSELSVKLLTSEVMLIRSHFGGSTSNYSGILYIIK